MQDIPLVSILIPTYNQPEFFRLTLESAINQTYSNIEIIVSDDSTDDRVKTVFDEYKNCGRNLKYLKHGGYTDESITERTLSNMEFLLEHANGEFVNILFHDDLIYPQKIATMMKYFLGESREQVAIVSSVRNWINRSGKICGESDTFDEMNLWQNGSDFFFTGEEVGRIIFCVYGNFVGELSTVLIRRKDFYRACVKKLSPGYFLGVKDRTMWDVSTYLEVCKDGRGLVFLREPLSAFRLSGGEQNTFNANIRLDLLLDWLAFLAGAYLNEIYLHTQNDFIHGLEHWAVMVGRTTRFLNRRKDDIPEWISNLILKAYEATAVGDYETALSVGIEWIQKYSSKTFEFDKARRLK